MISNPQNSMRVAALVTEPPERGQLIQVLRTQVHSGRYHAEPEQVAEQLIAWFYGVPA
jgi:hypothetical protein